MAKRNDSTPDPRPPLSRDRVLQAAIALADDGGLELLTMRRLGQELGVEAMSLYNHVADKEDILDGIIDLVLNEVDLSPPGSDWAEAMRKCAISVHEALLRHPWACGLILSPTTARLVPGRIRYLESVLRRLREADFSAEAAYHGYHALDSHILGFTLWELGHSMPGDDAAEVVASILRDFPFDDYPYIAEHADQHRTMSNLDDEGEFEFGLDLILDGLERMRGSGSRE